MNNRLKLSIHKQGRCRTQDQVDERETRQFTREANRREAAALSKYGLDAYDHEDIRRDERGRILR